MESYINIRERALAGIFTAWFLFIQLAGSLVAIEIEHSHSGEADHMHHFANASTVKSSHTASDHDGHHHHHHHHSDDHHNHSNETEGNDESGQNDSIPSKHSHVIAFNVDVPASLAEILSPIFKEPMEIALYRIEQNQCPNGPSFDLIKPPQLV